MANTTKSKTLMKGAVLINYTSKPGLNLTPLLVGPHGIGKTMAVKETAEELGGRCLVIPGDQMSEGEVCGTPFAFKTSDGLSEVRFVKYYVINEVYRLQMHYYKQAVTTGFLNGRLKLIENKEKNTSSLVLDNKTIETKTAYDKAVEGEDNIYSWGETLPGNIKMDLITSGEIKPVILFVDELNRAESQTMKELMNIILNKSVNGYNLPWWVNLVAAINPCSQNSSYATNELDDAQLDRFLKIRCDANLDDWIDYALDNHLEPDIVEALSVNSDIFIKRDDSQTDQSEMSPSPRSWEMVCHIYDAIHDVYNTKFFNQEERNGVDDDLRTLIRGKVGDAPARTLLETIRTKENNIKPNEILTGASGKLDPKIIEKFNKQKRLTQKVISDNVVNYLASNMDIIQKKKSSSKPEEKKYYTNFMLQLSEFVNLLDTATQITFAKRIATKDSNLKLFKEVTPAFCSDVVANIGSFVSNANSLNN